MTIRRRSVFALRSFAAPALVAAVSIAGAAAPAGAQGTNGQAPSGGSAQEQPYIAVVTGNDVYVRSGAAESYYPFAKVNEDDFVKVIGERFGWLRVVTEGPAFRSAYGYIKHAKGDTARFRVAPDGKSGLTLGRVDIVAPNLDANGSPSDSWKAIVRLESNETLRVLDTVHTASDTIHKVELTSNAAGWINGAYLKRASDSQAAQYARLLSGQADEPPVKVASAPPQLPQPPRGREASPNPVAPMKPATIGGPKPPRSTEIEVGGGAKTQAAPDEQGTERSVPVEGSPPIAAPPVVPPAPPTPTLDDLEAAYELLRQEAIETAEVEPLRQLYVQLAARSPSDKRIMRYATGRAEQLKIWSDLQAQRAKLDEVRARMQARANETVAAREALERSAEYTAVGRIAASTIYDGVSLPKLYRVQDSATGRTVAYLVPDEEFKLATRIDTIVGIVGAKTFDESLRLNIITPTRIEALTPARNGEPAIASGGER